MRKDDSGWHSTNKSCWYAKKIRCNSQACLSRLPTLVAVFSFSCFLAPTPQTCCFQAVR